MAGITQYDQPAKSEFINTYSPIPFNEMMQAGQYMAKQYDQRAEDMDKIYDDTFNLKYIPKSSDEKYIKDYVIPTVKAQIEKFDTMDIGDPIVYRQAMRELNSKIDKNRVNKIQESYNGWMTHQQDKRKLALENELDPDEQDYGTGYDTTTNGVYNKQSSKYVDPILEVQKTYFDPIKDSTISKYADDLGNMYIKYGVDSNKIKDVTEQNIRNIKGTKLGDRLIRSYIRKYGINENNLRPEDRDNLLRESMIEAGESFKRSNDRVERLAIEDGSVRRGSGRSSDSNADVLSQGPQISLAGTKAKTIPSLSFSSC
jgi:hypothetical protein